MKGLSVQNTDCLQTIVYCFVCLFEMHCTCIMHACCTVLSLKKAEALLDPEDMEDIEEALRNDEVS